jgi:hypothetical protein
VPVDVYNAEGYFQPNELNAYSITVRSQPIFGNGGHDNCGRGEKVSDRKVKEIGVCAFRAFA